MATIKFKRGSGTPSGLTAGEPAFDTSNNKLWVHNGTTGIWVGAEVDNNTLLGTSQVKIPTQYAVKSYVDNNLASGAVTSVNGVTGAAVIRAGTGISVLAGTDPDKGITISNIGVTSLSGTANEIELSGSTGAITIGLPNSVTITTNLTVGGNLTVNGTTTTVNSTTVAIQDPIFTLGGTAALTSDDNKDRGIEFRWHNGSTAKTGFFGYDDSIGRFTFIPDATNSSEVFSGTVGDVQVASIYLASGANLGQIVPTTLGGNRTYTLPDVTGTIITTGDTGTITSTMIANGTITNDDINASAGIVDTKLATISTADKVSLSAINIDGGSDIGAAIADGDLLIIDDGGGGTNRKTDVTRIPTYVFSKISGDITINSSGVATIATNGITLGTDTTGQYASTIASSGSGLSITTPNADDATAYTISLTKINSGIDFGTFAFTTSEFTNNGSGTVAIGVVDGGSY